MSDDDEVRMSISDADREVLESAFEHGDYPVYRDDSALHRLIRNFDIDNWSEDTPSLEMRSEEAMRFCSICTDGAPYRYNKELSWTACKSCLS